MPKENNIRPLFFLLCEKTVTDQGSNNTTAINITEQISVTVNADKNEIKKVLKEKSFVNVPIKLTLLSAWDFKKTPNAFNLHMKITDPDDKDLINEEKTIEINDRTKRRQRINQLLQSFPVSTEGIYKIEQVLKAGGDISIQRTYVEVKTPFLK